MLWTTTADLKLMMWISKRCWGPSRFNFIVVLALDNGPRMILAILLSSCVASPLFSCSCSVRSSIHHTQLWTNQQLPPSLFLYTLLLLVPCHRIQNNKQRRSLVTQYQVPLSSLIAQAKFCWWQSPCVDFPPSAPTIGFFSSNHTCCDDKWVLHRCFFHSKQ